MGIVTAPMRKAIKVLMVKKYIDQCGIKMPKMPNIPKFVVPPMPDMHMLEEELEKIKAAVTTNNNDSIYTQEYLDARKRYSELIEQAKQKREADLQEITNERKEHENEIDEHYLERLAEYSAREEAVFAEYNQSVDQARKDTNIDEIPKFKKIDANKKKTANEEAEKETESKKNEAKKEALELLKKLVLEQYKQWLKQESDKLKRLVNEIVQAYEDTVALFKQVKAEAKAYFQDGGPGDKFVEEECDKIDRIFDNFSEAFKELAVDVTTLVAKIPNPDVIVAGAATGIPNPSQKIMIFMENMKKVLTDIKKIMNYIKEIIAIATAIGFAIKDMIPAFKKLIEAFEKKQQDSEAAFKKGVKAIRKRQKWYAEHEHPDEDNENETKLAGYMYADVEVDWVNHEITLKGYKCYCRKAYAKKYKEDGVVKKSLWKNGYTKDGGAYTDSTGKRYYYLTEEELVGQTEYDENDILTELANDGESISDYDVDLGTFYNDETDTTTLNLSDGRTLTIDYLAASGDVIRLDDGTIIRVK